MRNIVITLLMLAALPAFALDYRSLLEPATMYDAPAQKAVPLFVIARFTPVEVVVAVDGWVKVRDSAGAMAWIEKRFLGERRTVLVMTPRAQIRVAPELNAALAFEAEKDVVLELTDPVPVAGWAKVKHRDGQTGHVRVTQIWGI